MTFINVVTSSMRQDMKAIIIRKATSSNTKTLSTFQLRKSIGIICIGVCVSIYQILQTAE